MSDDQIRQHRDAIDDIDVQILKLINQRAHHAHEIGVLKGGGLVYRPEREAQVLRRVKDLNQGPLPSESVARLFREIMSACLSLEKPLTIAFLGPLGTFSESAVVKHFGHAAQLQPSVSIDEVFRQTEAGMADYAVVPVENSTEGAVGRSLDLMTQTPLKVCGEVVLRIHQHLMRKRPDLVGITRIYSHSQSLAQCHEWLNLHLPNAERIAVASNAEAARLAAEDVNTAAIGGEAAAERYELVKVVSNIEDEPNNTTRFLVLGQADASRSGKDKTSLVMSAKNQPGAVFQLLAPLAENGVSMTKLESRPSRDGLWEYVFFVDVEGHRDDALVQKAMKELAERAVILRVLGSYPVAVL
ncbi:chorismate mutase/prephenate dehydratase [Chitinivorax tropicus]|uniref:Bifunctional chorismate mutase/prephenate dehydratase n=1 Tax=Chitinivorax tropicus TaxID=714531 RepID=A0A840MLY2_9PROT|nr:prephenate dehydratase [Chitinivorax tropicus]MBB5018495.1 chorismate mutase/prephenate dehydratase [Chitinivorax tropicus]